MDFENILKTILNLFSSNQSNFDFGKILSVFQKQPEKQEQPQEPLNFSNQMFQLPHFDFEEKPQQTFFQQNFQEQQKPEQKQSLPMFDFEKILELVKMLSQILNNNSSKTKKEEQNSPSFVSTLKRCD